MTDSLDEKHATYIHFWGIRILSAGSRTECYARWFIPAANKAGAGSVAIFGPVASINAASGHTPNQPPGEMFRVTTRLLSLVSKPIVFF